MYWARSPVNVSGVPFIGSVRPYGDEHTLIVLASALALNKPLKVISMCNLFDFCIVADAAVACVCLFIFFPPVCTFALVINFHA